MTPARPLCHLQEAEGHPPLKLVYIVYMNEGVGGARVKSRSQEVNQVLFMGAEGRGTGPVCGPAPAFLEETIDRLASLNMHAPAPRPVACGALCGTAARLRPQSPAPCPVRELNEEETSGLPGKDPCLAAGSAPDSVTSPPSPSPLL